MGIFNSKTDGYIPRVNWDAADPLGSYPLHHPVPEVLVGAVEGHTYLKRICYVHDCMRFLRELQKVEMYDEGLPDIAYNFYIGGDGNVYEGRGWHYAPTLKDEEDQDNPDTLALAYIRPLPGSRPTKEMVSKVKEMIEYGVEHGYIRADYVIRGILDGLDQSEC